MRVKLENVDENQQRLFSKPGARLVTDRD